jgi:hypothetical protein
MLVKFINISFIFCRICADKHINDTYIVMTSFYVNFIISEFHSFGHLCRQINLIC